MKTYATLFIVLFSSMLVNAQDITTSVLFEKDSYELTDKAINKLNRVSKDVIQKSADNDYNLVLTGHTDNDGSIKYNTKLSGNRTKAVLQYLVDNGLESIHISIDYFGELQPKVENSTESKMALNRRVEILVQFVAMPKEEEVFAEFEPEMKPIPCQRDTVFFLPKGTKIEMNLCDFENNREAMLSSFEITTVQEMLENEVSLSTDKGEQLITGGMIKIANEDVKFGKPVRVTMPVIKGFFGCNDSSVLANMRLYRSNHSGDWVDSDDVEVETENNTSNLAFTITQGGMFNCDAIVFAPVQILAKGASILIAPLARIIQKNRSTLRFKAPKGEQIRKVSVATQCISCSQPYIISNEAIQYNKKRTKAKIRMNCCVSDEVTVAYKLRKKRAKYSTTTLSKLEKKGPMKLANCGSSAGVIAAVVRLFKKTPVVSRKYKLPNQ